jgi:hypothetical protein
VLKLLTADPRDSEGLEREEVCCESICRVQMRRGHYIIDVEAICAVCKEV